MITLDLLSKKLKYEMEEKDNMTLSKARLIRKNVTELYNDPKIMKNEPPYPYVPENVGKFFADDYFAIELLEEYDEHGNFLGFTIGKSGLCSMRDRNLNSLIHKWNKYCKLKIEARMENKNKQYTFYLLSISLFLFTIFTISEFYPLSLTISIFCLLCYLLIKTAFNSKKQTEKYFNKIIDRFIDYYSKEDIKILISRTDPFITDDIPENLIDNQNQIETDKSKNEIIEKLQILLEKINNVQLKTSYHSSSKNHLNISNINVAIKDLIKNCTNIKIENQVEREILKYTNNFIQALNLIEKYENLSDEMYNEISKLLNNYYTIFKYFNKSIVQNDELIDISKLKVLNQESKLYKDYIDFKEE